MVLAPLMTTASVLVRRGGVRAGQHGGQRGDAARLGDDAQPVPQRALRRQDRHVADQHHARTWRRAMANEQLADPPRGERVDRDAAGRGVDRLARLQRREHGRRAVRLHAHHPGPA